MICIIDVVFFEHESFKSDNKKGNDENKKKQNNEKELKDILSDIVVCFKLSFLKNSKQ